MSLQNKAIVYEDHTLGVLIGAYIQPLRASVLRGAPFSVHDEPILCSGSYRAATEQDFEDFRVVSHPSYF